MNSSFTDSNYTQLTEVYSRYKDKGLGFCALLSIFSIPVSVCVFMYLRVWKWALWSTCYWFSWNFLFIWWIKSQKKKKKICFVTLVLCRRPMLDFSGYYYYLRSYEIEPIKMLLLMFLLFFFFWVIVEGKLQCDDNLINSFWYGLFNIFSSDLAL